MGLEESDTAERTHTRNIGTTLVSGIWEVPRASQVAQ